MFDNPFIVLEFFCGQKRGCPPHTLARQYWPMHKVRARHCAHRAHPTVLTGHKLLRSPRTPVANLILISLFLFFLIIIYRDMTGRLSWQHWLGVTPKAPKTSAADSPHPKRIGLSAAANGLADIAGLRRTMLCRSSILSALRSKRPHRRSARADPTGSTPPPSPISGAVLWVRSAPNRAFRLSEQSMIYEQSQGRTA